MPSPPDPRDEKLEELQDQLDKVTEDIEAAKREIARDEKMDLDHELLGDETPVGPDDDVTPVVPPG